MAAYLLVFPGERAVSASPREDPKRWPWLALALPAFLFAGAFYWLQAGLSGPRMVWGSTPPLIYLQTQTFAWLHYARLFVLPLGLSADADWTPIPHWYDTRVVAGSIASMVFLGWGAWYARRREAGKAVLFGAIWFFVALAPTSSVFPLSEMINEHRPYLPFIGVVLCVTAAAGDALTRITAPRPRRALIAAGVALLAAHAVGTFARNRTWRTDETLWKSVTEASPGNGRAWMNYGLIFMARADYTSARFCFERAATLVPNYDVLEINRGILEGAAGRKGDAERHFQRAISLNSSAATAHFYFGRWLHQSGREFEAAMQLSEAVAINPADLDARHLLLDVWERIGDRAKACALARTTLGLVPADPVASAVAGRRCAGG